ncbi:MAG: hypothetical protein RIR31_237, partial [Bacteroidota bacterium]
LESFLWSVNPSESNTPSGLNFSVEGLGKHEFVLAHKTKAYQDTLSLHFVCTTTELIQLDIEEQETKSTVLKSDELLGVKRNTKLHKEEANNPVATFELFTDVIPTFLKVKGEQKGTERAFYTICDEHGVCDTIEVRANVRAKEVETPTEVEKDKTLRIYNGFSPNGDNVNDVFRIDNIEYYPQNTLHIYNRWGNLVFNKEGYNNDWNGTFDGNHLPEGTYFFVLKPKPNSKEEKTGYLQIER